MSGAVGEAITINALKFPVANGLSLSTDLQLAGANFTSLLADFICRQI